MAASAQRPVRDLATGAIALAPRAAPYPRAALKASGLMWAPLAAAGGLFLVGWIFYGPNVLLLAVTGLLAAGLAEWLCAGIAGRFSAASLAHSLAMGSIAVLMLPTGPTWWAGAGAAAVAAVAAVGLGKWLMGGLGHHPWNPAALGVIVLYMLWPEAVTPQRWLLLAPDHALGGNGLVCGPLQTIPALPDWSRADLPGEVIGYALPRPESAMLRAATATSARRAAQVNDAGGGVGNGDAGSDLPDGPLLMTIRDLLPGGWDMLIGAVPAPIGGGSTLALVAAGLLLIWRGYLRWQLPLAVLAGALTAAAVLPAGEAGWLPIRYHAGPVPVGLLWTMYHVLLGSTLFAAVILAGETVSSPMTTHGQIAYGFGVGVLTVALRWWPVALLAGCWAVLAMNTLVPVIDWLDRRWRLARSR